MTATSIHSAPALRARLPGLLAWLALLLAALWCVWMAVQLVWALFTPLAYVIGPVWGYGLLGIWLGQELYRLVQTGVFVQFWRQRRWAAVTV